MHRAYQIQHDDPPDDEDVLAMVRILGAASSNPGDRDEKRRELMVGLCRLIGADFWTWSYYPPVAAGSSSGCTQFHHGGVSPVYAGPGPESEDPASESTERERAAHAAVLERIAAVRLSPALSASDLFDIEGFGAIIHSLRPTGGGAHGSIGLYRHQGRLRFDARQMRLAHIMLTEVPWLHSLDGPESTGVVSPVARLSRSERIVLDLLCEGHARKEIATRTGLSEHTVKDYVKAVYRCFGVNNQPQLIRRLALDETARRPAPACRA